MLAKALIRGIAVAIPHVAIQQEVGLLLVMEAADAFVTEAPVLQIQPCVYICRCFYVVYM